MFLSNWLRQSCCQSNLDPASVVNIRPEIESPYYMMQNPSRLPRRIQSNQMHRATTTGKEASGSAPTSSPGAAQGLIFDVLSTIFIETSVTHSLTALDISRVCRHWRQVALATPKMWSTIPSKVARYASYQTLYLARSEPALLHVTLSAHVKYVGGRSPIFQQKHRIQCLAMGREYELLRYSYPNLEKLSLVPLAKDDSDDNDNSNHDSIYQPHISLNSSYLKSSRFPRLKVLVANKSPSVVLEVGKHSLQTLQSLKTTSFTPGFKSGTMFICKQTLVSLSVTVIYANTWWQHEVIDLPRLLHLQIIDEQSVRCSTLEIIAPRLVSVHRILRGARPSPTMIKLQNRHTVTHLCTPHVSDMNSYPGLRSLWLENIFTPRSFIASQMETGLDLCPHLETIRCIDSWTPNYELETKIRDTLRAAGSTVRVLSSRSTEIDLPGSVITTDVSCSC